MGSEGADRGAAAQSRRAARAQRPPRGAAAGVYTVYCAAHKSRVAAVPQRAPLSQVRASASYNVLRVPRGRTRRARVTAALHF